VAFAQSSVDVSFWSELGSKKLDEYQLSETPIDIAGTLFEAGPAAADAATATQLNWLCMQQRSSRSRSCATASSGLRSSNATSQHESNDVSHSFTTMRWCVRCYPCACISKLLPAVLTAAADTHCGSRYHQCTSCQASQVAHAAIAAGAAAAVAAGYVSASRHEQVSSPLEVRRSSFSAEHTASTGQQVSLQQRSTLRS
jgi:hypothetical protein